MNDEEGNKDEVLVRQIVEAEAKAALARFRAGRFQERLNEKLGTADAQPARPSFFRAVPRPIWISAAALVLVGAALLGLRLPRAPASNGAMTVASFLRRLPLMQAMEKTPQISEFSALPGSPLGEKIHAALSRPNAQPGASNGLRSRAFKSINLDTKPMDLEELYDILIGKKSVERVLTDAALKTKEG
jgi:hypothetical protein